MAVVLRVDGFMKYAIPLVLSLLTAPSLAAAQSATPPPPAVTPPPPAEPAATTPETSPVEVVREGGRTIYRVDLGVVHGDVARPYSFGITARAPLGYTLLEDRRSFLVDVTRAVRRDPF